MYSGWWVVPRQQKAAAKFGDSEREILTGASHLSVYLRAQQESHRTGFLSIAKKRNQRFISSRADSLARIPHLRQVAAPEYVLLLISICAKSCYAIYQIAPPGTASLPELSPFTISDTASRMIRFCGITRLCISSDDRSFLENSIGQSF
jgi:hypothetical protein